MKILSKFFFIFLSFLISISLCSFKNKEEINIDETYKTFIFSERIHFKNTTRPFLL